MRLALASCLLLALATGVAAQIPDAPDSTLQRTQPTSQARPVQYGDDGLDVVRAEHRSARLAVAMTIPVPGWGQMYADAPFWSVVAFATQSWFLGNALMERRRMERQRVKRDYYQGLVDADPGNTQAAIELDYRQQLVDEHRERARDFLWWAGGGYFVVALDAYVSVELAGFDDNSPPTPDLDKDWDPADDGADASLSLNFRF